MEHQQGYLARFQDWLVGKALGAEIAKAGLRTAALELPFGRLSYLHGTDLPGARSAIVLLHGAGADNTGWLRFARELKAGVPLLIPDLPGHGASSADPVLSYSIAAQTERLAQLFAALGLERVHLVANSMSGAIALKLAADAPSLVSSLVLIGAMGVRARASWLERRIAETGRNPMVGIRDKGDYLAMLKIGMEKPPYLPGFAVSALARVAVRRAPLNQKIARDIEADLDRSADLAAVACPVLLIWGREDRISDVANGEHLQRALKDSQLTILEGIGHVPMVEAPRQTAELCRPFLARAAQAAPAGASAAA